MLERLERPVRHAGACRPTSARTTARSSAARGPRGWLHRVGVRPLFIEPGSPWENGYCESSTASCATNYCGGELFDTLLEAQVLIERWRRHYNACGPTAPWAIGPRRRRRS